MVITASAIPYVQPCWEAIAMLFSGKRDDAKIHTTSSPIRKIINARTPTLISAQSFMKYIVTDQTELPANQAAMMRESNGFNSQGQRVLANSGEIKRIAQKAAPKKKVAASAFFITG